DCVRLADAQAPQPLCQHAHLSLHRPEGELPLALDDGRRVAMHERAPRDHVVDRESVHTHLRSPVMRHARHCPTMSAFMGPSAARSYFFSRAPTLYFSA